MKQCYTSETSPEELHEVQNWIKSQAAVPARRCRAGEVKQELGSRQSKRPEAENDLMSSVPPGTSRRSKTAVCPFTFKVGHNDLQP